jgi:uncharacterized membrane protein YidH (DUF202 family)
MLYVRGKVIHMRPSREKSRYRRKRRWLLGFSIALIMFGLVLILLHFFLSDLDAAIVSGSQAAWSTALQWNLIAPSILIGVVAILIGGMGLISIVRSQRQPRPIFASLPVATQSLPAASEDAPVTIAVVLYDTDNQLINITQAQRLKAFIESELNGKTIYLLAFHRFQQMSTQDTQEALADVGFTLIQTKDDAAGAVDRRIQEEMQVIARSQPTHTILITNDKGYSKAVSALHFMRHYVSVWGYKLAPETSQMYHNLNAWVKDITGVIGAKGDTRKTHRRKPKGQ